MKMDKHQTIAWIVTLFLAVGGGLNGEAILFGTDYSLGALTVTRFDQPAVYNGANVTLTPADTLTLSGGTLAVNGDGSPYSALLGTGSGSAAGFAWGTGGTVSPASDVALTIDVLSAAMTPLTQSGSGTLNLTAAGTQNLQITQNAGILNVSGSINSLGNIRIAGTTNVTGDLTDENIAGQTDVFQVDGTLHIGGELYNNADQMTVTGTVTAQSAQMTKGGLYVDSGGSFTSTDAANFSAQTAVVIADQGTLNLGANSQIAGSSVSNAGDVTLGDNTVFTNLVGNAGTIDALGSVTLGHLYNGGTVTGTGDLTVTQTFTGYGGTVNFDGNGSLTETAILTGSAVLNLGQSADFGDTLLIADSSAVRVGDDLTADGGITLTGGSLTVGGNLTTGGELTTTGTAALGLSNRLLGSTLGNVTTAGINLASATAIDSDFSGLARVQNPTLLVRMISGDSTDDFLIDNAVTNVDAVGALFGTSTVLRKIYAVDNGTGYDIFGYTRSLGDYAESEGLEQPAVDAGNSVDDLLNNTDPSDPAYDMAEDLLGGTESEINETLYNLAKGYGVENVFALMLGNLGQAGSPFFFGHAAGPLQKKAWCQRKNGAADDPPVGTTELWAAPFYRSADSGGNFYQDGFNVHETGFIAGGRMRYSPQTTAGVLFAYGAPKLSQSGSLSGYNAQYDSEIDLDDYQYAVHLEQETANHFLFSVFVGGGSQSLKLRRQANGLSSNEIAMNQTFTGKTKGNTLSANAYLARPFCVGTRTVLAPTIGIDSVHAWLYSFDENASGGETWKEMTNLSEGNFYSPAAYGKTQCSRNVARAGLRLDCNMAKGGFNGQIFYGTQLGGDPAAVVPVSTLGGAYHGSIYGMGLGRDTLNLGGGLWRTLDSAETTTVSAHYNYLTLNDAEAINVTAALTRRF